MRTLNQIISKLNSIATNHVQVKSFGFGTLSDLNVELLSQENFPMLWVQPVSVRSLLNTKITNLKLYVIDSRSKTFDNLIDILSDTELIIDDIRRELIYSDTEPWIIRGTELLLNPEINITAERLCGWSATIQLESIILENECYIPKNN